MRILPERVVFAGEQLVEVRLGHTRVPDDHGVGGDVAEALAAGVEPASQAADKIKRRQRIHKPQQVAHDNLVELQPHPLHVHHAQAEQPLADGLAAPGPLQKNSVADADDKITDHVERDGKIPIDQPEQIQAGPEDGHHRADAKLVNEPREEPGHRSGQPLREHDPLGRSYFEFKVQGSKFKVSSHELFSAKV